MKNVGIIGYGVVGKAFADVFEDKVRLFIYDKNMPEYNDIGRVVKNCPVLFVAVPTPMYEDGSIDLSYVNDVLNKISAVNPRRFKSPIITIRSTIVPGTTAALQKKNPSLRLVYNPEFLSERNSLADMERTDRVVIGGELKDCKKIEEIYRLVFPYARYIITDSTTAEMIKYSANVTLAGQVRIANELYQISQKLNVDWAFVRNAIILDPLIGRNTKVPGPDGDMGFGGKCLPKDLNALIYRAEEAGCDPELLRHIWQLNLRMRKNKNWNAIKGATSKKRK